MGGRNVIHSLSAEKKRLEKIIRVVEKRLQSAPEGTVRISAHGKGYQFYLRTDADSRNGRYLPVSERKLAVALMQKKYDLKILSEARKQAAAIQTFLKRYDPDILKKTFSSLHEVQKGCIETAEISDQEYVQRWIAHKYEPKPIGDDIPEHYTQKGERVRSKSEVMIADALAYAGIPYRYECPVNVGGMIYHPDFTILREEDRKELFWEHLGRMDETDYCRRTVLRIRTYEKNGIIPGRDLILTMETSQNPLNLSVINQRIAAFCV